MFHTVVQQGFQGAAKKSIFVFVDNSLLFLRVKEFSKLVNNWSSYCKNSKPRYVLRHCVYAIIPIIKNQHIKPDNSGVDSFVIRIDRANAVFKVICFKRQCNEFFSELTRSIIFIL